MFLPGATLILEAWVAMLAIMTPRTGTNALRLARAGSGTSTPLHPIVEPTEISSHAEEPSLVLRHHEGIARPAHCGHAPDLAGGLPLGDVVVQSIARLAA